MSIVTVLSVLLICAALAMMVGVKVAALNKQHPVLGRTHSHNDYAQRWPLTTALRQGFVSVEADVWPVNGELLVGHDREHLIPEFTLRRLYLEPLAKRVRETGSVYIGMKTAFQLLIEFKSQPDIAYPLLARQLAEFPGLWTSYSGDVIQTGPISVIVTGKVPRETIAAQHDRLVACDGTFADIGSGVPVSLVPLCSDNWRRRFRWRGFGRMPAAERAELHRLVDAAHAEGRTVRFWGAPVWPVSARNAAWRELVAAGVDFVGADHLVAHRRWSARHRPAELS